MLDCSLNMILVVGGAVIGAAEGAQHRDRAAERARDKTYRGLRRAEQHR